MLQLLHKYLQTHVFYKFYCTFIYIWDPTMHFYKKIYVILDVFLRA